MFFTKSVEMPGICLLSNAVNKLKEPGWLQWKTGKEALLGSDSHETKSRYSWCLSKLNFVHKKGNRFLKSPSDNALLMYKKLKRFYYHAYMIRNKTVHKLKGFVKL